MTASESTPPDLRKLLRVWLSIGIQSFGGGQATSALIRRAAVEEQRWLTDEEYGRITALCQMAPGMNLLALTALIGQRLRGGVGVAVALLGLLLPSVGATIVIAAMFRTIGESSQVRAALQNGIVPATVGIGLYSTYRTGAGMVQAAKAAGGRSRAIFALLLCAASAAAATWLMGGHAPVFLILGVAGGVAAIAATLIARRKTAPEEEPAN